MREQKKHWVGGKSRVFSMRISLCGLYQPAFANKQRAVTCKNCARILAGYQGSKEVTQTKQGEKHER